MSAKRLRLIVFTASTPREIIEEMNRRLSENGFRPVKMTVEKIIRKTCKCEYYNLYPGLKFLISEEHVNFIKSTDKNFICFQKVHGKSYYEQSDFNPKSAAILVGDSGIVYRYLPNYSPK